MKKKVLLTGAGGFVGANFLRHAVESEFSIFKVFHSKLFSQNDPKTIFCDLKNESHVSKIFELVNPEIILHFAESSKSEIHIGNQEIGLIHSNLIAHAQSSSNLKSFIFLGSCDEYGDSPSPYAESGVTKPLNAYGKSKLRVTEKLQFLHSNGSLPSIVLRPSIVYGPGQAGNMLIPNLFFHLKNRLEIKMTGGDQFRDFLYIDDLIELLILLINDPVKYNGEILNVGFGSSIKVVDVINLVTKIIGNKSRDLISMGAIPYRKDEVFDYFVNIEKVRRMMKWSPKTSNYAGLKNIFGSAIF